MCSVLCPTLLLLACPAQDPGDLDDDTTDSPAPTAVGCRATPPAADRDRVVLAALPYDDTGAQADTWAVLRLDGGGALHDDGQRLTAGRSILGRVRWTPDGSLGFVATDDGELAVFDTDGEVSASTLDGDWYAGDVLIADSGEEAFIVDPNWPENGGGIYRVAIDCETGALGTAERVVQAKLAGRLLAHPDGPLLIAAQGDGFGAWRFDPDANTLTEAGQLFPDEAVLSDAALTWDGRWLVAGDHADFTATPHRVAFLELATAQRQELSVGDPIALVPSPDGPVLSLDGYGNTGHWLSLEDSWRDAGAAPWTGASPQLPGAAVWITRGPLSGLTLIAENQGIRGVRLAELPQDDGLLWSGSGVGAIVGAVGVQP